MVTGDSQEEVMIFRDRHTCIIIYISPPLTSPTSPSKLYQINDIKVFLVIVITIATIKNLIASLRIVIIIATLNDVIYVISLMIIITITTPRRRGVRS